MALQMATNISPSTFAGVGGGVFDAEKGLKVSWQVNGSSALTAYQIVLQKYDNSSTPLYTTGRVALAAPFYGVLADGTVKYFEANEIAASALTGAGITNGNSYKMVITQWWGSTAAESITQSSAVLIEAWSEPSVTINAYDSPLTRRVNMFTATYTQAQNDPITWVRWRLYNRSTGDEVLKDTGPVYGTGELSFYYDAFFTGTIYGVEVTIETQSGQQCTSGIQTVYVSYAVAEGTAEITAEQQCSGGVMVQWNSAENMQGVPNGVYQLKDGQLILGGGGNVEWSTEAEQPIRFDPPYSFFWQGIPSPGLSTTATGTSNLCSFSTNTGEIALKMTQTVSSGTVSVKVTLTAGGTDAATTTFTTSGATLEKQWVIGYSGGTLYAKCQLTGSSVKVQSASASYGSSAITSVRLSGKQTCDYLWIESGTLEEATVALLMGADAYTPVYDESTYFLTNFEKDSFNAGNTDTTGYSLYRIDHGTGEYLHLADLELNQLGIVDYGARNGHSYSYQLWYSSATVFTRAAFTSNTVTPCKWDVMLLAAQQGTDGAYHPQAVYTFGLNVETKEESNNNSPSVQKNFTRYPNWQPESSLYRTGSLTALIGKCSKETNLYSDTTEMADEIMELSGNGYDLFLHDRKGNLRRVRPNGSLTVKVEDTWPNQAVTMTFPWVEVGTADGLALVLTSKDALWPVDQIVNTTVSIDNETGKLGWEIADDYLAKNEGSVLAVEGSGDLTQTFTSETVRMADMEINDQQKLIAKT